LKDHDAVARAMATPFAASLMGAGVDIDSGNPRRYVIWVGQGGFGLPAREYYLLPGEPYAGVRVAYRDYIEETFKRAGIDHPRKRADDILALETAIAERSWDNTEMRDPVRMYHLMKVADLKSYAPQFNWTVFLDELGYGDQTEVVVSTDTAVQDL